MSYTCAKCGHRLTARELEISVVKTPAMKVQNREPLTEISCPDCGWVASAADFIESDDETG